jgi:hypothetical protein
MRALKPRDIVRGFLVFAARRHLHFPDGWVELAFNGA